MGTRILPILVSIAVVIASLAVLQDVAARASDTKESFAKSMSTETENGAPVIDLNGPDPDYDYHTTFTEDEGPVPIVGDSMTISDTDSTMLISATVTLSTRWIKSVEFLTFNTENTNLDYKIDAMEGVLHLYNEDTISNYQKVLRSITYVNLSDSPKLFDRFVIFQVFDGINYSNEAQTTILIESVNDAPILNNNGDLHLSNIEEDDTSQFGNRVASFIDPAETGEDWITDPDENSLEGVAIIEVDSDNGIWQFSTDAGNTWHDFGPVTNNAATLLDPTARIRFLPELNFYGTVTFTIRAWDQTFGQNGDQDIDTSVNGGSSAFSIATDTVRLEVLAVNDPPIPDLNGIGPGNDSEAYYLLGSGPAPIAAPQGTIEDVDNEKLVSAVITLINPDGADEFLESTVIPFEITVGPYDPSSGELRLTGSATLAEYNDILRGIMYNNESGKPTLEDHRVIKVVADDGEGEGPATSTTLQILSTNNAPELDPNQPMNLSAIYEDDKDTYGDPVKEIIKSAETDPIQDDEGALRGFAIVGAPSEDGEWQYSVDAGSTWWTIGVVSDTMAILVDSNARIKFLPDANSGGFSREISIRAWDQSAGVNGSQGVDVSQNGGKSAYSSETASVSIEVLTVAKRPKLVYMPIVAHVIPVVPESDEPNDTCQEAYPLSINEPYEFQAEDKNDWYSFSINNTSNVTVELTGYEPEDGQILVAKGQCDAPLELIGHNGDFDTNKIIKLDNLQTGRYYIWLITDNIRTIGEPYKYNLMVNVQ